jgi:hypothetical protein
MTRRWSESSSSGQDTGTEIGTDWRVVSFHFRAPAVLCLIGEFALGLESLARSPGGSSRQHDKQAVPVTTPWPRRSHCSKDSRLSTEPLVLPEEAVLCLCPNDQNVHAQPKRDR